MIFLNVSYCKVILVLTLLFYIGHSQKVSAQNPNVLVIVADDLGLDALDPSDYGFTVTTSPTTPYVQSLKNTGVSFLNTWATPQCTTTRASILSGKYGIKSGVRNVPDNLDLTHESLFSYLNNNLTTNYAKGVIGKWHISNPENINHPYEHGADFYEGVISGVISDYYSWGKVDENGNTSVVNEYVTQHFTNSAINWVANQTDPWFLWLSHIAPHSPFHVPPSGTYTQTNVSNNRGKYLAAVESLDFYIGELLNSMDQATKDNTVIIFIGDNGTPNGVARYFPSGHNKATMYEGGLRVPMIISGNGVTRQGELESGLVQVNDIYATVVELISNDLEGGIYNSYSVASALTAQNTITRPYIYSDYIDTGVEYWAIRNDTYKVIENGNGDVEFYNVVNDLEENIDLTQFLTNEEAYILSQLRAEAAFIRNDWSCIDQILNGTETTTDDCTNCPTDLLNFTNIGCCDNPTEPTVYYEYVESVSRKVYTNNYPDHDFCYNNASNVPAPAYHDLNMPLVPALTGNTTSIIANTGRPLTTFGVALNGVIIAPAPALPFVFLNTNTNQYNWDWVFEPTNNQGAGSGNVSLDCASAHSSTAHGYHYHGEMFSYLENETTGITSATTATEITQVGWAADGFPILYKFGPDATGTLKSLQPSYKLKDGERPGDGISEPCGPYTGKYTNDYEYSVGLGDLDECNGINSSITLNTANGSETFTYFYVVTSTFPQLPRCFVGTRDTTFADPQITGTDNDGDGFIEAFDCDDTNAIINPLATEIPGNSIDENCDLSLTLSIKTYEDFKLQVYPNPSASMLRLISNFELEYSLKFYDLAGKLIFQKDNSPEFISIEHLPKGVYFLKIFFDNFSQTHKIIKKY